TEWLFVSNSILYHSFLIYTDYNIKQNKKTVYCIVGLRVTTATLIPNDIHHPTIEDGRLLPELR
ncbi:hypothetical protein, partial [uncultured Enterococcus sp.]|uniref:hypothetical protein n=1 Tax=uncultured Enterococcus sp. TaxID=167972 RepID=UPI00262B8A3D